MHYYYKLLPGFIDNPNIIPYNCQQEIKKFLYFIVPLFTCFLLQYSRKPSSIQCGAGQCTYLCYTDLSFNECENQYENMQVFLSYFFFYIFSDIYAFFFKLIQIIILFYLIRTGFVPCNSQLPTLRSVSTPKVNFVKNLPTCFPSNCACRKTER